MREVTVTVVVTATFKTRDWMEDFGETRTPQEERAEAWEAAQVYLRCLDELSGIPSDSCESEQDFDVTDVGTSSHIRSIKVRCVKNEKNANLESLTKVSPIG